VPYEKLGKRVTKIIYPKSNGKITVYINNEKLVFSSNSFTDFRLFINKELSTDEYHLLKARIHNEVFYSYALKLALKGKSRFEIKEKMIQKGASQKDITGILTRLKENGYLDELASAQGYVEEREYLGYGKKRIIDELAYSCKYPSSIIDKLTFKSEESRIFALAESLAKKYEAYPYQKRLEKVENALLRKGYSSSLAKEASLSSSHSFNKDKEKKQMLSVYYSLKNRYEKKYDGYELERHLYEGMRQKGYTHRDYQYLKEELAHDFD